MTTVLVVDDSVTDRRLAGGLIEKGQDFLVLYAANGKEALKQVELHLPDIIVTDLRMPEMDGLQLLEATRESFPLIPVVIITSKGSEEIAVKALEAGASSYVPKSLMASELVATLDIVLTAARQSRAQTRLLHHRMVRNDSEFVIDNDLTLIPSLINYLQTTLKDMNVSDEPERVRVGVALEEALLNAIYHGNLEISSKLREENYKRYYDLARERSQQVPYQNRRVFVTGNVTQGQATYTIRDEGPGFDPSTIPDPTDPSNLYRPYGRGLLLMQTFMDSVKFNETGNEVTLIKQRSGS